MQPANRFLHILRQPVCAAHGLQLTALDSVAIGILEPFDVVHIHVAHDNCTNGVTRIFTQFFIESLYGCDFVGTRPAIPKTKKHRTTVAVYYVPAALIDWRIADMHYVVTVIIPHKKRDPSATCTANAPVEPRDALVACECQGVRCCRSVSKSARFASVLIPWGFK